MVVVANLSAVYTLNIELLQAKVLAFWKRFTLYGQLFFRFENSKDDAG